MSKSCKYEVAGHLFEVVLPDDLAETFLAPYERFTSVSVGEPMFTLILQYSDDLDTLGAGEVKECLNAESPYFWILEKDGKFNFGFSYTRNHPDAVLIPSEDFRNSVVHIPSSLRDRLAGFALNNSLMLLYTFCTGKYDTLLVHASVVRYDGGGYMFLGRSGTGKSTHSRMWLSNIEGAELLNDDNPVVRVTDGKVMVYGTPWSGKTPCYRNESVPLKAVVRLSQAPHNKVSRNLPVQAYASLMPACSCMRWDRASTDALHKTVEKVISSVACWHLECLPDADAARVCHNAVTK